MFKDVKGEDGENAYSAFDEQGIPTLDGQGQDLPKSRIKKLKKEWDAQKKLHTEYLAWVQDQQNTQQQETTQPTQPTQQSNQ